MPADAAPAAANPYGTHQWGAGATGDYILASPDKCPTTWTEQTTKIDKVALTALNMARVPYYLIIKLADKDYVTCGDIGDRFADSKDVLNEATLKLLDMQSQQYSMEQAEQYLRRLVRAAKVCSQREDDKAMATSAQNVGTVDQAQLADLKDIWKTREGHKYPMEYDGSEAYETKQLKETQRGQLGNFTNKQIIGRLPDPTVRTQTTKIPINNTMVEFNDETKLAPDNEDKWKDQMRIFYYVLTKCIHASTSWPVFADWDLEIAKAYWENFLFSDQVLKRRDRPSLATIMIAERKAWNEITLEIYRTNCTLRKAVENIMNRTLFWTNELNSTPSPYLRRSSPYPTASRWTLRPTRTSSTYKGKTKGTGKGKVKGKNMTKGKGKKGSKGKPSKGKGKTKGKNKTNVCYNFHFGNGCNDRNCPRQH